MCVGAVFNPQTQIFAQGRLRMTDRGKMVAEVLAGVWRRCPSSPSLSAEQLGRIAPLLTYGGEAALVWARVRNGRLRNGPEMRWFRDEHRRSTTTAFQYEEQIQYAISRMRAGGVEPILIKGWANARHYADPGLRPYSDIDLCVRPEQHAAASAVVRGLAGMALPVDLHRGIPDLPDRSWDELYRRSRLLELGGVPVRVLGPEDHLRLLCLHLVRHGAWRMLWLCDVGASLESQPDDFDWDYSLSGRPWQSEWVVAAMGLAGSLLGVRVPPPIACRGAFLAD